MKILLCAAALVAAGTIAAQADMFDVLNKVGNIANKAAETQKALEEGRVPNLKGGVGGKGGSKRASSGGHHKK